MPALTRAILIEQGATWKWGFTWHDPQLDENGEIVRVDGVIQPGEPKNLTGCTARMQVRKTRRAQPVIDATTENGLITITPEQGRLDFVFDEDITDALVFEEGLYDIEVRFPSVAEGGTVRLFEGSVVGKLNVTRAVEPA